MKIAAYQHGVTTGIGVVEGDAIRPLPGDVGVLDLLASTSDDRERAAARAADPIPLAGAKLRPPLVPPSVRDFVSFEEHVEGVVRTSAADATIAPRWYDAPQFYFTNPHALVGAHDDVPVPPGCEALDYELEVAAIVGRDGRDLTPEEATKHIGGYTIFNDWSARDIQELEMQVRLGPAKAKDFATTLGPWIVTPDELESFRNGDRLDLDMRVAVNGQERGDDTLANMGWSFEEMLAYASRGTWVKAGDVIGSGTCGSGCLAELWGRQGTREPPPLVPGDVVTMSVEALGTISNTIVAGGDAVPLPQARPPDRRPRPWDSA